MENKDKEGELAINSSCNSKIVHENPFDSKFIPIDDEKINDRNSILRNPGNLESEKKENTNIDFNQIEEVKKDSHIEEKKLEEIDQVILQNENLKGNASKMNIDFENLQEKKDIIEIKKEEQNMIFNEIVNS